MILRGDRNQCPTCSEYFNSSRSFEKHRIGPFNDRKCMTKDEMTGKGMSKNRKGFWITAQMPHGAYR